MTTFPGPAGRSSAIHLDGTENPIDVVAIPAPLTDARTKSAAPPATPRSADVRRRRAIIAVPAVCAARTALYAMPTTLDVPSRRRMSPFRVSIASNEPIVVPTDASFATME